ncbi:MAG: hypothetical protein KTR19_11335 [Hyphomicrobiales bacterium]|nr:hypothetical protein [Hyphomicrobiales bacterium]
MDLSSGTLLSLQSKQERPQETLNVLTKTITELFEAPLLQAFSEIYSPADGEADASGKGFGEILLLNDHHNYLLLKGRESNQLAVIIVTTKDTPVGLMMMKSIAALPAIERAF